ncbi:MAG TPA: TIGR03086 family metal-binding protein, partial [Acidimicrobiales bacterium]|nr:TIGR03086 family metal-binding protein [Acidimicrobiales bacterium]
MTRTDHRPDLIRSYACAAEVTAGVRPEQLNGATPCPEYDVASLVDHLVGAGWRSAALGRGEQPAGEEFPHVELSEAPTELRRAAKEADASWADDGRLVSTTTMPWGEVYTGETLVNMYLAELAAHAWDLAFATGQIDVLDPTLAEPALDAARAMLKPEYRDLMGPGNPFGAEVAPPPDATAWERFAA